MKEYIDKEALLEIVGKMPLSWEYGKAVSDIYDIIKDHLAADVVERKRGEWMGGHFNDLDGRYEEYCSNCGAYSTEYYRPFCSNCGADMRSHHDSLCDQPMTKADRIRAMSDEELAEFLANYIAEDCYTCRLECCVLEGDKFTNCCINAHYKWLKQPVKEDA